SFLAGWGAENGEEATEWDTLAVLEPDLVEPALRSLEGGDLAAVADGDAVALEVADQIVGHRLAEVGSAVEQRDEGAAAGEPDGGLSGRVAAADDGDARGAAQLRLGRPGRVERTHALVVAQAVVWDPPVVGACGDLDGVFCDHVLLL